MPIFFLPSSSISSDIDACFDFETRKNFFLFCYSCALTDIGRSLMVSIRWDKLENSKKI